MATLTTNPGTLRTEALPSKGESKTIISQWIDAITTEVSNGNVKTHEGFTGPTISARLYSMVGTAAYEAWQSTEENNKSSVGANDLAVRGAGQGFVENLISSTILKVAASEHSGVTAEGKKNLEEFANKVKASESSEDALINKLSDIIAEKVINKYKNDGYDSSNGYTPINTLENVIDIELWTPEFKASDDATTGRQQYLTPQWGDVKPFAITAKELAFLTSLADTPEPFLIDKNDSYDLRAGTLNDASTGQIFKINPSLIGSHINPRFIDQANRVIEFSKG